MPQEIPSTNQPPRKDPIDPSREQKEKQTREGEVKKEDDKRGKFGDRAE